MANAQAGDAAVAYNLAHAARAEPLTPVPMGADGMEGNLSAATEHGGEHAYVPGPYAFGLDATGWVALAMIAVIAIMLWKKVPAVIGRGLDSKIATIRKQLDEAAKLRAEAEALKAEYEAKAKSAEADAAAMREHAHEEARQIVAKAEADAADLMTRRAKMAEDKIAAAERSAIAEVRAKAASAAAAAAADLIAQKHDAGADKAIVDRTIAGLGRPN
jgi:F-type H+-transporting ATPase subunit b